MNMIRKILVLALLISCVSLLQAGCQDQAKNALTAQKKPEIAAEPDKPSPRITFENVVYDFGEVGPTKKNTGEIKFTNTGEALLKITKVARCCGVVTNLEKMEYEPGESGILKVTWNSGSRPSTMRRKLTIHSNDPKTPQTVLNLKAKVVLQVDWEPKSLRLFLDKENAGCPKITVNSLDNRPFSILQFKSTANCITADFDSSIEATKFILEPKVDIDAMPKKLKGSITINLTHPEGKNAAILFSVVPQYTIKPSMIIIWDAQPGKAAAKKIDVLNNYNKDFEIESVTSRDNVIGVNVTEQRKIPNGYRLVLELTAPALKNKTGFMDELTVNIKGGEKLTIRCNGRYPKKKPKPEIK
ncbi:MAG: DUF1573 domain-containing protein [Planctomycetota bacterium]|jgi:hypothetical protein